MTLNCDPLACAAEWWIIGFYPDLFSTRDKIQGFKNAGKPSIVWAILVSAVLVLSLLVSSTVSLWCLKVYFKKKDHFYFWERRGERERESSIYIVLLSTANEYFIKQCANAVLPAHAFANTYPLYMYCVVCVCVCRHTQLTVCMSQLLIKQRAATEALSANLSPCV